MQTFILILQVLLFLAKVALGAGLVVFFAYVGTMAHDEISDWLKIRRAEAKKRLRDANDTFFADLKKMKENRPPAKHRLGVPRADTDPLFPPPRKPLTADITFFEQLLEDREQTASLF